jgi:probable F420-dependent oxidoreductase
MKVGVNLLNFGTDASPAAFGEWAQYTEQLGYHLLMISDHVAITPDVQLQYPPPFYDPFITLAWIAAITTRVEIGTTVAILPYRHPLLLARMASNIDQLSGGRFVLGVGTGWAQDEFRALGIPFERRGAIADECLAVIDRYWASDSASFQGRFVAFDNVATGPRPVRSPRPPIWVGGKTDAALRRAVRFGDAWHPIPPNLTWVAERLPKLKEIAAAEDKPMPAFCPRVNVRISASPLPEAKRPLGHGDLTQIRSDMRALVDMGAECLLIDTFTGDPYGPQLAVAFATLQSLSAEVFDLKAQSLR